MINVRTQLLLFSLGLSFILSSCDSGVSDSDRDLRESFVRDFVLLNGKGEVGPAVDPRDGTKPFVVVIFFDSDNQPYMCSSTHFEYGKLTLNGHCVNFLPKVTNSDNYDEDHYVLFFDKNTGKQNFHPIKDFGIVGNQKSADIAVLNLPHSLADRIDVVSGGTVVDLGMDEYRKVTIWSFDPLKNNHPELFELHGPGAKFSPKVGYIGSRVPRVHEVVFDKSADRVISKKPLALEDGENDTLFSLEKHVSLDFLTEDLVHGNSGGLISLKGDPSKMIGVIHWGILVSRYLPRQPVEYFYKKHNLEGNKLLYFEYQGNYRNHKPIATFNFPLIHQRELLFSVGTRFTYLNKLSSQ